MIRDEFGNGGQSAQQVKEGLRHLDIAFNPLHIFFEWDCDIDYIDDQVLFESFGLNNTVYGTNAHDDGIDLYLFPERPFPLASGSGHARVLDVENEYFGKELIVFGNFKIGPDYQNLVSSHILSHEMGHCLGLRHTHEGEQLLNDPQCNIDNLFTMSGDHICDTPPDPLMNFDVSPNDCTWNGQQAGFDPDEKNIMGLTHLNCLEEDEGEAGHFTFGQGQWIRNTIANFSELEECVVPPIPYTFTNPVFSSTPNITSGEINAGEYRIQGDLTVESGFTLTIESGATLIFEKDAKLIVKRNARLNLYGTLTAGCRNTWEGVEVWSDQSVNPKSQGSYYENNTFVFYQGRLHTYPESVIENAEVGVRLFEYLGDGVSTNGGGILNADGTLFRNNRIGIQTAFYDNFYNHPFYPNIGGPSYHRPYKGKLSECTFQTDYYYPHADTKFTFVDLKAIDGFLILGCDFTNTHEIDNCEGISEYGTGVFSHNSGFLLGAKCLSTNGPFGDCVEWKRSKFYGLGFAVQANNGPGESEEYIVKQTDFENCYIGINGRQNTMPTILHNRFYMGTVPSSTCENVQYGISFEERLIGITLEENQFIDEVGGDDIETIGINVFRILSFDNTFRRNTFDGLDKGNLAVGFCAGLVYECNVNTNVHEYDFLVKQEPINLNSSVNANQGILNSFGQFIAAGNEFSGTGASDGSGFRNEATGSINYHYFQQTSQDPTTISFNVDPIEAIENTCPVNFVNCEFPCLGSPNIPISGLTTIKNEFYVKKGEYLLAKSEYDAAILSGNDALGNQKLFEMKRAREGMNEKISIILPVLMRDTLTYSLDSIRAWRSNMESYEFDMINAASYLSTNQVTEALDLLNAAPAAYNLTSDEVANLQIMISVYELIGQKTLHGLDKEDLDWLFGIADNVSIEASGLAKSILEFYNVAHYPPIYFESSSDENQRIGGSNGNDKWKYELKVQPNPANDYIEFTWNQLPEKPYLKLYNSVGTIVWEGDISNENNYFYLSTDFLQSGIYYYQLYNGVNISNARPGKLIIQKQ